MTWFSKANTREQLIQQAPFLSEQFQAFYSSFWQLPYIPAQTLELCRLRLAQLHQSETEFNRVEIELASSLRDHLSQWSKSEKFSDAEEWRISLDLLLKKCGSTSPRRVFKKMIKELIEHDHLPDYTVSLEDAGDMVVFENRERLTEREQTQFPRLDPDIYNDARIVAPGYDPYWLEREWQEMWMDTGCPRLRDPDKAFLAFCRRRAERAPMR